MSSKQWSGEVELLGLLQELCGHSSVPTSKVKQIVTVCNKHIAEFKMVVYEIEKFIKKSNSEDKLGGLFVIDSLCRQHSKERETFAKRFSIRLRETLSYMAKIPPADKSNLIRMVEEWRKKNVFAPDVLTNILVDFNGSSNIMSPTGKGEAGDDGLSGKKRVAEVQEIKKAVRLCPFREGNCPYGEKCRFSHHDSNNLEQYAARLLKPLSANVNKRTAEIAAICEDAVISRSAPAVLHASDANKSILQLLTQVRDASSSSSSIVTDGQTAAPATNEAISSLCDPKYFDKRQAQSEPQPPLSESSISSTLPSFTFRRQPGVLQAVSLPPGLSAQLNSVPAAESFTIDRDAFLDLFVPTSYSA